METRIARAPAIKPVLLLCVFLSIFGEVLLSPFYPQFFQKVFGIQDLSYTGLYIFICRLTVVLCSPIWGLLTRWFQVKHLLYVGQAGTVLFTALMATAATADQFLLITACLLVFKSSYMFVYPLLIELMGSDKQALSAGGYHAAYHSAITLSSLAGVWMFQLAEPLALFYWIAATDLLQLVLCWWALKGVNSRKKSIPADSNVKSSTRASVVLFVWLGCALLAFHLAVNMIRPFFTRFTESRFELSLMASTIIYLIPNVMAVIGMPLVKHLCRPERLRLTFLVSMFMLAASLWLQGQGGGMGQLLFSRALFGLFLIFAQASLEIILFSSSGDSRLHMNYSFAVSFSNVGQLLAPLAATALATHYGLGSPLVAAAGVSLLTLLFFWFVGWAANMRVKSSV